VAGLLSFDTLPTQEIPPSFFGPRSRVWTALNTKPVGLRLRGRCSHEAPSNATLLGPINDDPSRLVPFFRWFLVFVFFLGDDGLHELLPQLSDRSFFSFPLGGWRSFCSFFPPFYRSRCLALLFPPFRDMTQPWLCSCRCSLPCPQIPPR